MQFDDILIVTAKYVSNSIPNKKLEDHMKFYVALEPAEEGGFNVSVPVLEGCFTQGETEEEALENAREAILCYLEGIEKLNEIKGMPGVTLREVEVSL